VIFVLSAAVRAFHNPCFFNPYQPQGGWQQCAG
jgi:hypothetical protein